MKIRAAGDASIQQRDHAAQSPDDDEKYTGPAQPMLDSKDSDEHEKQRQLRTVN